MEGWLSLRPGAIDVPKAFFFFFFRSYFLEVTWGLGTPKVVSLKTARRDRSFDPVSISNNAHGLHFRENEGRKKNASRELSESSTVKVGNVPSFAADYGMD